MSTPPLLSLPTSSCFASVTMTITRVVGLTNSPFTLEEQAYKWQGERWSMSLTMPPFTNREIASDWIAFGAALEGKWGHFLIGDPAHKLPSGVATGTPLVDGGAQTGNTLVTKGWSTNVTGILKKGDYIQLGSGSSSRLHMLVQDANSDSSGNANLSIVPALRSSPPDSSAIVVNNPKGVFRLDSNEFSWSVSPGPVYRLGFTAMEVL